MKNNTAQFALVLVLLLSLVNPSLLEAQCAMCKAALESSEDGQEVITGVKRGIGYLMLFPYVLMGGIAYFWYRNYKKAKNNNS
ncbi:MAG: hypothetical protein AB8B61_05600 [Cyclobacteriaceae bacterium]